MFFAIWGAWKNPLPSFTTNQKTLDTDAVDWLPWLLFFLRSLKSQKEHLLVKMGNAQGWDDLPAECVVILKLLDERRRLIISEVEKHTDVSRRR